MIRKAAAAVIALAFFLSVYSGAHAAEPLTWQWLSPLPQTHTLNAITYGDGQFVAVGDGGAVVTSTDGKAWAWQPTTTVAPLRAVAYGSGTYVAAGGDYRTDAVVIRSADGVHWIEPVRLPGAWLTGIAYGAGQFVVTGADDTGGAAWTSTDGETWHRIAAGVTDRLVSIAFGNGTFLAFTSGQVLVSSDGVKWTAHPLPGGQGDISMWEGRVIYTGTAFAAIGTLTDGGINRPVLLLSTDGEHWAVQPPVDQVQVRGLAYADGHFIVTGSGGDILTSTDGAAWETITLPAKPGLNAVTCHSGTCAAVGLGGEIVMSADMTNWLDLAATGDQIHGSVVYGDGRFLSGYMVDVAASTDGVTWRKWDVDAPLMTIFYRNGRWLAGGTTGNGRLLLSSTDGHSWQAGPDLGVSTGVESIAYGKGRYILGMYNSSPRVFTADLKPLESSIPPDFHGAVWNVAFGKGVFAGVSGTKIFFTGDGLSWTEATLSPARTGLSEGEWFFDVTYGDGRFVAVGGDLTGFVYTSPDGKTWTQTYATITGIQRVIYGGGRFLAWGPDAVLTSTDGEHWTAEPNRASNSAYAYGDGRFVAVGPHGTLMTALVCGERFPDVAPENPVCDAAEALARQGILSGYPDGTFRPAAPVTRAELVKMLVLTLGLKPLPDGSLPFTDTAGHWAGRDGYLQAAVSAGLINGYPDGTFRPEDPVTRAELTKIAAAAAGLGKEQDPLYSDVGDSDWFAGWVAAARHADLIGTGGYHPLWADDLFQGNTPANRGESATLLDNLRNH